MGSRASIGARSGTTGVGFDAGYDPLANEIALGPNRCNPPRVAFGRCVPLAWLAGDGPHVLLVNHQWRALLWRENVGRDSPRAFRHSRGDGGPRQGEAFGHALDNR